MYDIVIYFLGGRQSQRKLHHLSPSESPVIEWIFGRVFRFIPILLYNSCLPENSPSTRRTQSVITIIIIIAVIKFNSQAAVAHCSATVDCGLAVSIASE